MNEAALIDEQNANRDVELITKLKTENQVLNQSFV